MSELVRLLNQRYQDTGDTLARRAATEIERLREEIQLLDAINESSDDCIYTQVDDGITINVDMDDRYQKYLKACSELEDFRYPDGHPDDV